MLRKSYRLQSWTRTREYFIIYVRMYNNKTKKYLKHLNSLEIPNLWVLTICSNTLMRNLWVFTWWNAELWEDRTETWTDRFFKEISFQLYLNFKLLWSGGPNYDTEVLYWFIAALSSIKIVVRVNTYVLKVHIYNINNPIKGLKIDMKVHINEIDSQNYWYQIYFCV